MIKQCTRCGKEFDARGSMKYCSDNCRTEARREQSQRWKAEHHDELLEKYKRHYQQNKDRRRDNHRRWVEANSERNRELQRRYAANHREERRAYGRRWYEVNREKHNESGRRWYETRGKHQRWVKKRVARLRKILEAKAAARQAQQPKRERHWTDNVSFPLVSSCQSTYIY